ncbi:MAG: hypothetical protein ACK4OJ_12285 [Brevundimonas sp.]
MGEEGGVEDRHPADAEDGVAVDNGAQGLVLNHFFRLDRDAGRLWAVGVADRAGGEYGVVQLVDVLAASDRRRRHQAGAVLEPRREIDGDRRLQVSVGFEMAGVDDRALGRDGLDPAADGGSPAGQIIGQIITAQDIAVCAQIDTISTVALDRDDVARTAR